MNMMNISCTYLYIYISYTIFVAINIYIVD